MSGFGQVIVGPPGSGKTTYCHSLKTFCDAINRPAAIINLDPANDKLPYECAVDIAELITIDAVMEEFELGPNGGLIYCMEFLVKNREWLRNRLAGLKGKYLIFDLPGQVELYTHHQGMYELVQSLQEWGYRVCTVNLIDSFHCADAPKFISVLLLSLVMMRHLELPHLNVLSKIDLIEQFGETDFNLDFYTDVLDLEYLLDRLEKDVWASRYRKLNQELCDLIESHALVSFTTLSVTDKQSMASLLKRADKANGYVFDQLYGVMRPEHAPAPEQPSPAAAIREEREQIRRKNRPFADGPGAIDPVEELGTFRNLAVQQRYMGGRSGDAGSSPAHHHSIDCAEGCVDEVLGADGLPVRDIVDSVAPDDEEAGVAEAHGLLAQYHPNHRPAAGAAAARRPLPSQANHAPAESAAKPSLPAEPAAPRAPAAQADPGGPGGHAAPPLLPVIDCAACGFPMVRGSKLRCARCRQAYYCDAACQKKHWPAHRKSCTPAQPQ